MIKLKLKGALWSFIIHTKNHNMVTREKKMSPLREDHIKKVSNLSCFYRFCPQSTLRQLGSLHRLAPSAAGTKFLSLSFSLLHTHTHTQQTMYVKSEFSCFHTKKVKFSLFSQEMLCESKKSLFPQQLTSIWVSTIIQEQHLNAGRPLLLYYEFFSLAFSSFFIFFEK